MIFKEHIDVRWQELLWKHLVVTVDLVSKQHYTTMTVVLLIFMRRKIIHFVRQQSIETSRRLAQRSYGRESQEAREKKQAKHQLTVKAFRQAQLQPAAD